MKCRITDKNIPGWLPCHLPDNVVVTVQNRYVDCIFKIDKFYGSLTDKIYENDATTSKNVTHSDETAIRFPAGSTAMQRMHAAAELVTTASISGSPALYCRTSESLLPENHALCCLYGRQEVKERPGERTLAASVIIDSPASIAVGGS